MVKKNEEQVKHSLMFNFIMFFIPLILFFISINLEMDLLIANFIYIGLAILIINFGYRFLQDYLALRRK